MLSDLCAHWKKKSVDQYIRTVLLILGVPSTPLGKARKQRRTPQPSKKHATTEEEELTSSDEEKAPAPAPTPAASKGVPKKIVFEDSKPPPPPAAKPINKKMALQCASDSVAKAAGVDLVGKWWFCLIGWWATANSPICCCKLT